MLYLSREINGLLEKYPDPRKGAEGRIDFIKKKEKDTTDSTLPEMAVSGTNDVRKMKEIESRIYVDLWKNNNTNNGRVTLETIRKITVGFLKKEDNIYRKYRLNEDMPNFGRYSNINVVLTIDPKDTGKRIYIDGDMPEPRPTSETSSANKMYIPVDRMPPDFLVECTLRIQSPKDGLSREGEIEITAYLVRKDRRGRERIMRGESRLLMNLYRCSAATSEEDSFQMLKEDEQNKDIFVMPRLGQEEKHRPYIKKLQLYSNQVLARHKGIQQDPRFGSFNFVKEDGEYREQLGINYGMSVGVFRATEKTLPLNRLTDERKLYTNIQYDLSTFGQTDNLVNYLVSNYDIDEQTVRKIVVDRNFIYGQREQQARIEDVQGLKNLYDRVVQVFRQRFVAEAERYVNFPIRWLTRPGYNPNYRRGDLTIVASMNKNICNAYGVPIAVGNLQAGYVLPTGTIVSFLSGKDEYDYDRTNEHRYRITSIRLPDGTTVSTPENQVRYIPLRYEDKRRCNDRANNENFCNYIGVIPQGMSADDRRALEAYRAQNGVPYYISPNSNNTFHGNTGGKLVFSAFEGLAIPNIANWYLYPNRPDVPNDLKPNAPTFHERNTVIVDIKGVGLDCSGLIVNCLLDCRPENRQDSPFFIEKGGFRGYGENAYDVGNRRSRQIPLGDAYRNGDDLLVQTGDLIYSQRREGTNDGRHIALCVIDSTRLNMDIHMTSEQKRGRNFTIIHNYGNEALIGVRSEYGFFQRTLKGPFRHWGVDLDNMEGWPHSFAGRIYLWY